MASTQEMKFKFDISAQRAIEKLTRAIEKLNRLKEYELRQKEVPRGRDEDGGSGTG